MVRQLTKENIRMANKHMKRYTKSLVVREMQTETTIRHHDTPIRMGMGKLTMPCAGNHLSNTADRTAKQ